MACAQCNTTLQHRWLKSHVNSGIRQSHPADHRGCPSSRASPALHRDCGRLIIRATSIPQTLPMQAGSAAQKASASHSPPAQGSWMSRVPVMTLLFSLPLEAISSLISGLLYHKRKIEGDKDPRLHNFPSAICLQHACCGGRAQHLEDHLGPKYLMTLRHLKI